MGSLCTERKMRDTNNSNIIVMRNAITNEEILSEKTLSVDNVDNREAVSEIRADPSENNSVR